MAPEILPETDRRIQLKWKGVYLLLCKSFFIRPTNITKEIYLELTLSGRGGGGSEARMTKLTAANQKPLTL